MSESLDPSGEDMLAVARQLGREPRGDWSVATRCPCGLPQVIETHPRLEDGSPFPTLWWLTCRTLGREVSRLESMGAISRLNQVIAEDPSIGDQLSKSTDAYLRLRDRLEVLDEREHPGGGPRRIKCLHAHVAHHLVTGDNPIGDIVLKEIAWTDPSLPCA